MNPELQGSPDGAVLVSVRGLRKSYCRRAFARRGLPVEAVRGVDLDIRAGTTLALVGESGSGKSTLARCLALLEKPDSGEISFCGKNVSTADKRSLFDLHRKIQLIFQDPASALNPRFTAEEIVGEPMGIQKIGDRKERRRRVRELLAQVALPGSLCSRFPYELSGGQRQRLAIARALSLQPSLLILDESLSSLDLSVQAQLVNLLLDLQADRSLAYLFITHDLSLVAHFADEVAVMSRGEVVEKARTTELFGSARNENTRALIQSIPTISASFKRCTI